MHGGPIINFRKIEEVSSFKPQACSETTTERHKNTWMDAASLLIARLTHCSAQPLVGGLEDRTQDRPPPGALVGLKDFYGKPDGLWLAVDNLWLLVSMRYGKGFRAEHFGSKNLRTCAFSMYQAHAPSAKVLVWATGLKKPNYAECEAGMHRDKMLVLLDAGAISAFHRRYRVAHLKNQAFREAVDWSAVAAHFAGVFVMASAKVLDACNLCWLLHWELPSACVWRPNALRLSLHPLPEGEIRARVASCASCATCDS